VALQKLFQEITGRADQPFVMSGGNYARVIPNAISFGPGMPTKKSISDFLPAGRGYCHGKDEAVIMEKVHNCAKIYVLAIAMLDEMLEDYS
jgi:succinyl-diaminopimelate desuccinylase